MILRRLSESIRKQDWFTVVLEVLIVVVGIFIGLQVDDWNEERKDRALEQEYLSRLASDIAGDIARLDDLERVFTAKTELLLALRDDPMDEILAAPSAELARRLDYTTWKALPNLITATFMELASSGRLVLLQDKKLRTELSNYYEGYALLAGILAEPDSDYRTMYYSAIPGEMYVELRLDERVTDPERLGAALDALRAHPDFKATANAEVAYATGMIYWMRQYRARAEALLERLGPPANAGGR